jgi:glutamate racemase
MIGIFDSGLGGLTILKELRKVLPKYNFIYFADSARVPYGEKTRKEIFEYTKDAVEFLFKKNCIIIIIACNTSSAIALRKLQKNYLIKNYPDRRILGVVVPNIEVINDYLFNISKKNEKSIGLIGTVATVKSRSYEKECYKKSKDIKIYSQAIPELVSIIENCKLNKKYTKTILHKYLDPLLKKRIKGLLLACTHFPLLKKEIENEFGKQFKIIDTTKTIAIKTKKYLKKHPELERRLLKENKIQFYSTGNIRKFKNFSEKYLKLNNIKIKIPNF